MTTAGLRVQTFRIGGMTCVNCQNRIEKALRGMAGVESVLVRYQSDTASVCYDSAVISPDAIIAAIEKLGYTAAAADKNQFAQAAGLIVLLLALYVLLRAFNSSSLAVVFPTVQAGMGYGMVLIIGLLTSVHCIAMCGGINLSQTLRNFEPRSTRSFTEENKEPILNTPCSSVSSVVNSCFRFLLLPSVLYNVGRLISYTLVGVVVGALGSVITVSGRFQGIILLLAGVFMVVMGVTMLGLFPGLRRFIPHLPKIFAQKIEKHGAGRGPLVVGFLNGFMPCGPLQAMQLYALSTGSPVQGGVSMLLFCLGTIPLMFMLGAAGGVLSRARRVMQVGAALIAAMGLVMLGNGWALAGLGNPLGGSAAFGGSGAQVITSTLLPNRYPAITVKKDVPVRWIINAPQGSINGCNYRMVIREYGIEHTFKTGDNIIEFMPTKAGRFSYSCWMGMIRSSINVIEDTAGAIGGGEYLGSAAGGGCACCY